MNKFSDYQYERPDMNALQTLIKESTLKIQSASSEEETFEIFSLVRDAWQHLDTLRNIAEIRNTIDTLDPYYEAETNYLYETIPVVDLAMVEFKKAILQSPYLDTLKNRFGSLYFERMEKLLVLTNEKNVSNLVEENKLVQRYHKTAAAPVAQFHGESLNFYGLLKKMQDTDRKIRKEALESWSFLYESISSELNEIYTALIQNRTRQAQVLGFKDYTEMVYLSLERFDYNRDDVAAYREMLRQYVVPVVSGIYEKQSAALGIDKLHYYDEDLTDPEGNAVPTGSTAELLTLAQKMYHELSAESGEFFDFMMEHDLFDLETRPGKQQGGYCTFLSDMKAPFIFSNFNGTSADIDVLTHEAGHAFEAYTATRHNVPDEIAFSTSEVAEIHSMSMEFLTYPWMDFFFPGCADRYRRSHLQETLRVIPYMACVDEFQHEVYEKQLLDADARYALWHALEEKYMPWRNYDGIEFLEKGGFWMQKQHIFMCPFYYIDYSLASMGALEYFLRSRKNRSEAWDDYYRLCCQGGKFGYKELLSIGRLSDPFAPDTVKNIMNELQELLD